MFSSQDTFVEVLDMHVAGLRICKWLYGLSRFEFHTRGQADVVAVEFLPFCLHRNNARPERI